MLWGCLGGALLAVVLALVVALSFRIAHSGAAEFAKRRDILVSLVRSGATVEAARQRRGLPGRLVAKPADPYSVPEMRSLMTRDKERIEASLGRTTELLIFTDDQAVEVC